MSLSKNGSNKWERLFSIAVVFMLIGAGALVVYAANIPKSRGRSSTQDSSQFYTQVANTLAALDTSTAMYTPLPTDTIQFSPTPTGFPQFSFTPQDTAFPVSTTAAPIQPVNSCNDSSFVSDVTIPDNTVMAPGQSFIKTWAYQNSGTCTWNTNYKLVYISGDLMGGNNVNLPGTVPPTQQINISISLVAPTTEGTYTGFWRLSDDQGVQFGVSVFVKIVVSNTAPTVTSTGTITPSRTNTPIASTTPLPSSTFTPAPSQTPVTDPTETSTSTLTPVPSDPKLTETATATNNPATQ
jgi:hypothetical protein